MKEEKCSVRGKVKCIFKPRVIQSQQSAKRNDQMYRVTASETLNGEFGDLLKQGKLTATEKFDGTCCLVDYFNGRPWLWARHDIKPTKAAMKKFKTFQSETNKMSVNGECCDGRIYNWDKINDFKEKPDGWKPAAGVATEEAEPDDIGHIVGWVPVDPSLRNHLWHLSVVDFNHGIALALSPSEVESDSLKIHTINLSDHVGETFELIGSNINANPYNIGDKKNPLHFLVQHGCFILNECPCENINHEEMRSFFHSNPAGQLEGIVWHGPQNTMFKLHRHHLEMQWPITPRISSWSVAIDTSAGSEDIFRNNKFIKKLSELNGQKFDDLLKLVENIIS